MYSVPFELHLKIKTEFLKIKIKTDRGADRDSSKCLLEHNTSLHDRQPMIRSLTSRMSTVEMVYTPLPFAVEASLAVNILKGTSHHFTGEVTLPGLLETTRTRSPCMTAKWLAFRQC